MNLLDTASVKSFWRGMDYYNKKMVIECHKLDDGAIRGKVKGSNNAVYNVCANLDHPKLSICTCAFADGRMVVCKHAVALYFACFPDEATKIMQEAEEYEKEQERAEQERYEEILKYVNSLTKQQLRAELMYYLLNEEIH